MRLQLFKRLLDMAEGRARTTKVPKLMRVSRSWELIEVWKVSDISIWGNKCIPFVDGSRKDIDQFTQKIHSLKSPIERPLQLFTPFLCALRRVRMWKGMSKFLSQVSVSGSRVWYKEFSSHRLELYTYICFFVFLQHVNHLIPFLGDLFYSSFEGFGEILPRSPNRKTGLHSCRGTG